jgi:hypothetical protein
MDDRGVPAAPDPPFRDRKAALVGYGWVLILVGGLCAVLALVPLWAVKLSEQAGRPAPSGTSLLFNAFFYLLIAACFVALGVGSIRARRWARALTLNLTWAWLAAGTLLVLFFALVVPGLLPGGTMSSCALVVLLLFAAVFFVLLPFLLLRFYQREDVRRTVEARDPRAGWTDRLPTPLLGILFALLIGAVGSFAALLTVRAVPLFGTVLTGWPSVLFLVSVGLASLGLAAAVYRQSPVGWWGLIAFHVFSLVNFLTFRRVDMLDLMRQMGYPDEQARLAVRFDLWHSPSFLAVVAAGWLALLLFLFAVRKHFRGGTPGRHRSGP